MSQNDKIYNTRLEIVDEFHPRAAKPQFYKKLIFDIKLTIKRIERELSSELKNDKYILKNDNKFYGAICLYNNDKSPVVTYNKPIDCIISDTGISYIDGFDIRIFNINPLYENITFDSLLNDLPKQDPNLKEFYSDISDNTIYAINGKIDYYRVLELLFEWLKEKLYGLKQPEIKHKSYFTESYNVFDCFYDMIQNTDTVKEMLIENFIFELLAVSETHIRIDNFKTYKYIETYISNAVKSLKLYSVDAWLYIQHYSLINKDVLFDISYKGDVEYYKDKFIELCKNKRKILLNELLNIFNNFEQIYNIIYKQNNDFLHRVYKRAHAIGVKGYRSL